MPNLKGVIYHSVKFCDYYSFEYAAIRRSSALPVLKIETDFTAQSEGQLDTRLMAFSESLTENGSRRSCGEEDGPVPSDVRRAAAPFPLRRLIRGLKGENSMKNEEKGASPRSAAPDDAAHAGAIYVGIDSGSTSTNVAAISENGTVLASCILRTGARAGTAAEKAYEDVRVQLGRNASKIRKVVATGYGRAFIGFADSTKTEISCHARGAHFADPSARCVIDIGGQDSKVICLDEDGNVMNFVMNDKCAAGTGRFLEMMAHTLETDLPHMSSLGLKWKKDLTISSTCTVFAESEVVSLIAENTDPADIVHALNKSVAGRTVGMVKRVRGDGPFMMSGGVARNAGVVKELENRLHAPVSVAEYPDLIGAIGAALFAREADHCLRYRRSTAGAAPQRTGCCAGTNRSLVFSQISSAMISGSRSPFTIRTRSVSFILPKASRYRARVSVSRSVLSKSSFVILFRSIRSIVTFGSTSMNTVRSAFSSFAQGALASMIHSIGRSTL